jgi:acyl dehydratase
MDVHEISAVPRMGPLFARALLPRLGDGPAKVPEHTLLLRDVGQDLDRLAAYDRVCGFTVRDAVPPTWLHVLTFPLHVLLLSDPESTVRLAGVVHVSNRLRLHRPVLATEVLDVSVRITNLRPHQRGALLDLIGEVRVGEELVWDGVSTYLAPGARVDGTPVAVERADFQPVTPIAQWRLPADLGRRYRRVSGDPNPIHTHLLAARAFGFARPIIHGMWTHARLLAAIEPRLPAAYEVAVSFTKPILLPGTVGAWWQSHDDGWTGAVTTIDGAKPHLIATVHSSAAG